jgi:aryl-alcohol dehydrogenase-like predicted oxidoreductase
MRISKITLGTTQLGMNYGIANINGKPNIETVMEILDYSWKNGINTFDTSPIYGDSEQTLGKFFSSKINQDKKMPVIISKLRMFDKNSNISFDDLYTLIKEQIVDSLRNLRINHIPIYLMHHGKDIFFKDGLIIKCLNQLKEESLVKKIGISTYHPEEAEASLDYNELDVIQVPINIFDHRLIYSGLLKRLKKRNLIILARSIYLQGLFFLLPSQLPVNLKFAQKPLEKFRNLINEYQIEIAKLLFLFIRDLPEITSMVIGVEKVEQLKINLGLLDEKPLSDEIRKRIFEEFSEMPEKIINPYLWEK